MEQGGSCKTTQPQTLPVISALLKHRGAFCQERCCSPRCTSSVTLTKHRQRCASRGTAGLHSPGPAGKHIREAGRAPGCDRSRLLLFFSQKKQQPRSIKKKKQTKNKQINKNLIKPNKPARPQFCSVSLHKNGRKRGSSFIAWDYFGCFLFAPSW